MAIVIDFSEKIEKFLNDSVTWSEVFFDYYLNFIPWINGLLWPLFSLIAVIFFTSRLAKNSEIIAILSSGVNYYRLLVPYIISASILGVMLWYGNNYLIPKATKIKNTFENTYIFKANKKTLNQNVHFYIGPEEKAFVRNFRLRDSTMLNFRVEKFENGRLKKLLKAERLQYQNETNLWTMRDYIIRDFNGLNESTIEKYGIPKDTSFSFTPEDFIRYSNQMEMMITPELKAFIDYEKEKGIGQAKKFQVE